MTRVLANPLGPTRLTIHGIRSGTWGHLQEVGRYTWRIVGYRWPEQPELEKLNPCGN